MIKTVLKFIIVTLLLTNPLFSLAEDMDFETFNINETVSDGARQIENQTNNIQTEQQLKINNQLLALDYYNLATYKYDNKNYKEAISDYNQSLKLNPNNIDAYYKRGLSKYFIKDYQSALEDFNVILKTDRNSTNETKTIIADCYANIGYKNLTNKSYIEAVKNYTNAINFNESNSMYYNNRGFAYEMLNKTHDAINDYNTALILDKNNTYAKQNIDRVQSNLSNKKNNLNNINSNNSNKSEEIIPKSKTKNIPKPLLVVIIIYLLLYSQNKKSTDKYDIETALLNNSKINDDSNNTKNIDKFKPTKKKKRYTAKNIRTKSNEVTWLEIKDKVIEHYGRKCIICGKTQDIDIHHKIPIKFGGTNTLENLIPLCRTCHQEIHHFQFKNNNWNLDLDYGKQKSQSSKEYIICDALENNKKLKIKYKSGDIDKPKITTRIIKPVSIELGFQSDNEMIQASDFAYDKIYIKAFCELRNDERLFRLDRIIKIIQIIN